jgi:RNA polymerase sigma-70 factor (ECF subfamily)
MKGTLAYTPGMEASSDEELIARYRLAPDADGSRVLVEEVFRRHHARVVAWCFRMTSHRTEAIDLAQDVFLKAWTNLHAFRGDSKFTSWLYVIARNRCHDALRAREARSREVPESEYSSVAAFTGNDALATLIADDARLVVRRLMDDALDETEKRVMTLHFGHEMRLDAITAALGLTNASGAKAKIVSARRKLNAAVTKWKQQV